MLFLEKQTAEVVGIVKAKGVRDLFDRKLGGAKQLDGVHRLALIDILEGRHSHMLFEKTDQVLGGQITVGTKILGGNLFVVILLYVGQCLSKREGQSAALRIAADIGYRFLGKGGKKFGEDQGNEEGRQMRCASSS